MTDIPLKFWFCSSKDPTKFPKYEKMRLLLSFLEFDLLEYNHLVELKSIIGEYESFITNYENIIIYNPNQEIYDEINSKIYELMKDNAYYKHTISMTEDEIVNGYRLYPASDNYITYDNYVELIKEICEIEIDDLKEWLDDNLCSAWNNMDENGWEFPDGSYEKENAYWLTRESNINKLMNLPYSKSMIAISIRIGCNNMRESVRYSNFICEWISRKQNQIIKEYIDLPNEILSKISEYV